MDKQFVASEIPVKSGHFRLFYSGFEAVVESDRWKQLLLKPPPPCAIQLWQWLLMTHIVYSSGKSYYKFS